ncbi:MAG: hypothetical protein AAF564_18290 [Bacteroidota bacterium]
MRAKIANKCRFLQTSAAKRSVKEASRKFLIYYRSLTPSIYTTVKDRRVMFTIRSLSNPRRRRNLKEDFWEAILIEFKKLSDVNLAYPTQQLLNNLHKGEQGYAPDDKETALPQAQNPLPAIWLKPV